MGNVGTSVEKQSTGLETLFDSLWFSFSKFKTNYQKWYSRESDI